MPDLRRNAPLFQFSILLEAKEMIQKGFLTLPKVFG